MVQILFMNLIVVFAMDRWLKFEGRYVMGFADEL